MRALCESCTRPQPIDWRPGDQCIWCGQAVRREVRCFWCAKWTPAAKFCRTCGAATVEPEQYGASRMLKDAGTDRFTVPRQLREFDPEQIENFTRIYQEHAVVAAHHVSQTAFLERYLEQRHWSGALDDTLTAQLPWPMERLDAMRAAARRVPESLEGLAKARAIGESTPFVETRGLAALARLALEDWSACDQAVQCLHSADETLRWEAQIAVSHWRVLYDRGLPANRRELIEALRQSPLRESAATRLALLGEPTDIPLPAGDFATALATDDVERLHTGAREGDPLMKFAAAQKLTELGVIAPVGDVLRSATPERQVELLQILERRKKPASELRDALFAIAESSDDRKLLNLACAVLSVGCNPADAVRIARAGRGDSRVYQSLLQRAALPPRDLEAFGEFLIAEGAFRADQFGMAEAAKKGRMPEGFVERKWPTANAEVRKELCRFAEMQLGEYGDDGIHRFLAKTALTPVDVEVQSQAWNCLYRWYHSFGYPRRRPLAIGPAAFEFFFGSAANFLARLEGFFEGHDIMRDAMQRDSIVELLKYPESGTLERLAELPGETLSLANAVAGVMRDRENDFLIRLACADFLGFLGCADQFRSPMTALLRTFAGSDLDLQSTRALELMAKAAAVGGPAYRGYGSSDPGGKF